MVSERRGRELKMREGGGGGDDGRRGERWDRVGLGLTLTGISFLYMHAHGCLATFSVLVISGLHITTALALSGDLKGAEGFFFHRS